jgi:hypothetical protein
MKTYMGDSGYSPYTYICPHIAHYSPGLVDHHINVFAIFNGCLSGVPIGNSPHNQARRTQREIQWQYGVASKLIRASRALVITTSLLFSMIFLKSYRTCDFFSKNFMGVPRVSAGFQINTPVKVRVMEGCLVLTVQD